MINFDALKAPFSPHDIEWRLAQAGEKDGKVWARCLAYITSRAVMDRLDEVVGPANWKNEYQAGPAGGVMCGLSIRIDGEWVTKWDGAENTDIEGVKGGLSGATKRAAVQWGIGRYLYDLEEGFAQVRDNGSHRGKTKEGKWFNWDPPVLPAWAVPKSETHKPNETQLAKIESILSSQVDGVPLFTEEEAAIVSKQLQDNYTFEHAGKLATQLAVKKAKRLKERETAGV